MTSRIEDGLAHATDSLQRSTGRLVRSGRRIVHDHPTAIGLGAVLGIAAVAAIIAFFALRGDRDQDYS